MDDDDFPDPEAGEPASCPWDEYAVRDLGRAAAKDGRAASDNPYIEGTEEHWNWQFGFGQAERDATVWNRRKIRLTDAKKPTNLNSNPEGT